MEQLTDNVVIQLFLHLLPGFLSAWVFYGLTSYVKPSQFERVVQALIFTFIIQILVYPTKQILGLETGVWGGKLELIVSFGFAMLFGFLFAFFANNDQFHKFFRLIRVSQATSYPSEWYGAFSNNPTYIVLHLDGDRRLFGWPKEWPSNPDNGHFLMENASWLWSDGKEETETSFKNVRILLLVPAQDVKMVEFIK